jgi:hypothetical protein
MAVVVVFAFSSTFILTFFCLDAKESNKEKIKAVANTAKK